MAATCLTRHRIGIDLGGTKIEIAVLGARRQRALRHRIDTPHGYQATLDGDRQPGARRGSAARRHRDRRHRHPRRDQPRHRAGEERQLDRAERPRLRPRHQRACSAARCGWRTTPTASPCPRRPTAPAPATAWCSASSSAPAAAAASWWTARCMRGRNRVAGEWGHNPLPWPRPDEVPGPHCWCGHDGCLETWVAGPVAGARLRRRGRARRLRHPGPRRRRRGAGAGGARSPRRPAGARAGARDQPARSRRDRAGRRAVQHGPSLHRAAAAGAALRVQRLRADADRAQPAWRFVRRARRRVAVAGSMSPAPRGACEGRHADARRGCAGVAANSRLRCRAGVRRRQYVCRPIDAELRANRARSQRTPRTRARHACALPRLSDRGRSSPDARPAAARASSAIPNCSTLTIAHIDCDAFYASVEKRDRPGACGAAGHRRRRRARRGHRRLLRRAHLRRAQRHADVQGAEGLSRRGGDPPGLRQIRRGRAADPRA